MDDTNGPRRANSSNPRSGHNGFPRRRRGTGSPPLREQYQYQSGARSQGRQQYGYWRQDSYDRGPNQGRDGYQGQESHEEPRGQGNPHRGYCESRDGQGQHYGPQPTTFTFSRSRESFFRRDSSSMFGDALFGAGPFDTGVFGAGSVFGGRVGTGNLPGVGMATGSGRGAHWERRDGWS
ncbi:hypothetical protein VUR80DRAFT_670 [Thermomyces stellatus]